MIQELLLSMYINRKKGTGKRHGPYIISELLIFDVNDRTSSLPDNSI